MKFSIAAVVAVAMLCTEATACGAVTLDGAAKPVFLFGGPRSDAGWHQAFDLARTKLQSKLQITIPYVETDADADADIRFVTEKLIKQGNNIVIGDSNEYSAAFKDMAEKYPHVAFINIANDIASSPQMQNLKSVYGRTYESQYLCGVVAGMTSKTGNIGFLAPRASPVFSWEINGYALGVRRVNPAAIVHVVFTGDSAAVKERAAALALIDRGADVLGQAVDSATPQIVAQERGIFATGHALDLHELAPELALCASIWVWDRYLSPEIDRIVAGKWQSEPRGLLGITQGGPDIACCSNAVTHDTMIKLFDARDNIVVSRGQVFAGPISDNENKPRVAPGGVISDAELWAMDWYVQGVVIDR